jgi:hypothetical protein
MSKQLLIYDSAAPVSRQRHADLSVKAGTDFSFAKTLNSVPLTAGELRRATADYVVVFAGEGDNVMPVAILGTEPGRNLFVKENGAWDRTYMPAFFRRYPFVFATGSDGKTFTVCVDEAFSGCNREGRGERLFDADGEHTQYLDTMVSFLKEYQAQYLQTRAFCTRLRELGVLEPMQAQFTLPGGVRRGVTGFMAVNRTKLKALDGEKLAEMARSDELELIYLHLHSLHNFGKMLERIGAQAQTPPAAEGDETRPDLGGDAAPAFH